MLRKALIGLMLLATLPARATILLDSTACGTTNVFSASGCPTGYATAQVTAATTATTGTFATGTGTDPQLGGGETILILASATANASATGLTFALPSFSAGSFSLGVTSGTVITSTTQYSSVGLFWADTSSAIPAGTTVSITATATGTGGWATNVNVWVVPFASAVWLYQNISSTSVFNASIVHTLYGAVSFGAMADTTSASSRTSWAGALLYNTVLDVVSVAATGFASSPTIATANGTQSAGWNNTGTSQKVSQRAISVADATITVATDILGCPPGTNNGYTNCATHISQGSTISTTPAFSTLTSGVVVVNLSSGSSTTSNTATITDSGITKSVGWSNLGRCYDSTTRAEAEIWYAVTSAPISGKTITATFASAALPNAIKILPLANGSIPIGFTCASGTTTMQQTYVPTQLNSMLIQAAAATTQNTYSGATTSPNVTTNCISGVSVDVACVIEANSMSTSSQTLGMTGTAYNYWVSAMAESVRQTGSIPMRMRTGFGTWLLPDEIPLFTTPHQFLTIK